MSGTFRFVVMFVAGWAVALLVRSIVFHQPLTAELCWFAAASFAVAVAVQMLRVRSRRANRWFSA